MGAAVPLKSSYLPDCTASHPTRSLERRIWGSHSDAYENSIFWDVIPCSTLNVNGSFGEASPSSVSKNKLSLRLLAHCFMLVSCLAYSSTLKVEAVYSFETSVHFQRTTRRYMPELISSVCTPNGRKLSFSLLPLLTDKHRWQQRMWA
jgi:hypothetical protein